MTKLTKAQRKALVEAVLSPTGTVNRDRPDGMPTRPSDPWEKMMCGLAERGLVTVAGCWGYEITAEGRASVSEGT